VPAIERQTKGVRFICVYIVNCIKIAITKHLDYGFD
jgi:hypothetical protein